MVILAHPLVDRNTELCTLRVLDTLHAIVIPYGVFTIFRELANTGGGSVSTILQPWWVSSSRAVWTRLNIDWLALQGNPSEYCSATNLDN